LCVVDVYIKRKTKTPCMTLRLLKVSPPRLQQQQQQKRHREC